MIAIVQIPAGFDHLELLAHEFEHIVEQVEGVNLQQLADNGSAAVTMIAGGVFETARAAAAGRAAVLEFYGEEDPAVTAVRRGIARAARGTWKVLTH